MILIAAIAVGAIAAFMIFNYVGSIEDRANEGAERVDVFVVRQDIPKGMTGEEAGAEGYIVRDKIARDFLPATAIGSLDQINGRVALNNIAANQVVVNDMFVDPAEAQVGFSDRLPESLVAVTLSFDQIKGVAGLLVPGDKVNVLYADTNGAMHVAYHQAEILAVGQTAAPQPGENITTASETGEEGTTETTTAPAPTEGSGLITFVVPVEASQLLASMSPSDIYLALTGPDYTAEPIPALDIENFSSWPGEDGGQLTPYGPNGREE
jgi:pilus assembly protein CpaB